VLLELARDCIERAMQDDSQPIPVIFNLSSWDGKQTLEDWLIKELRTKYNVPINTAQSWVMNDYLHLLLDGLDEVKLENREK
jgi:predicted NACHT family NTPase